MFNWRLIKTDSNCSGRLQLMPPINPMFAFILRNNINKPKKAAIHSTN